MDKVDSDKIWIGKEEVKKTDRKIEGRRKQNKKVEDKRKR
jgi:hypothetical protein